MDFLNFFIKLIVNPRDVLENIPTVYSYILLWLMVFAESGFLFGFFLPGDSLLFLAGFLASVQHSSSSQTILDIWILIPLLSVAAILGDNLGYYTGKRFGARILSWEDNFWFKKRYIIEAKKYYEKRGGIAIVLARFVPAIRTFAPIVAGLVGMDRSKFIKYNLIGGLFWVISLTLLGYFAGKTLEAQGIDIEKYIIPIAIFIAVVSVIMGYFESKNLKKENINIDEISV